MTGGKTDVWEFLSGHQAEMARGVDASLRSRQILVSRTGIYLAQANLGRVVARLTELDRELRRASGILAPEAAIGVDRMFVVEEAAAEVREQLLEKRRKGRYLPPPVPVDLGGFQVEEAETGSFELILDAFGVLGTVLNSEPVIAFLTTMTLLDKWARLRVWIRNKRADGILDRITGKELLEIGEELRKEQWPSPRPELDIELDPHPPIGHRQRGAMIRRADGTFIAGRSITHVTRNSDGSETIIYIEG